MRQIFGDFDEDLPNVQEYIIVGFSPSYVPLKQRWRNNGLSADFLADYLITFFPDCGNKVSATVPPAEFRGAVGYIANELLENAMKFNDEASSHPISIQIRLLPDQLLFLTTNTIPDRQIDKFQAFLKDLMTSDTYEMYITQLEKNALNENGTESKLGFLTMITDYNAQLGWKFEKLEKDPPLTILTTMVKIAL